MSITLMLMWDYDTPTGFAVSSLSRQADPLSDYACTDRILELLARHGIVSTFACVGVAAESGPLPVHNPAQIRAIHAAGHEVASHSHRHELIPALNRPQLIETGRISKVALEDCIGAEVAGFVPPWNRPFHHPRRLAISTKDLRAGGWHWQHSVSSLCEALAECGYYWVRVLYTPVHEQIARKLWPGRARAIRPTTIDCYSGVYTLRLNYLGYDDQLINWLAAYQGQNIPGQDLALVIYAHPHGIEHRNSQHWEHLARFTRWYSEHKDAYNITFTTPAKWLRRQSAGRLLAHPA
ncbi:MAG: polysaccharide deacetylase family protein [Chloroflexi bacterium]|nr:polysaccharide deacetylase family protein [Chloroflexota bacterium]MCI0579665.1 polysaccharide deacetylase family protein [Chloroflexota bacterium]MCI0645895.1 polysaccharide deacetylase family protein [Chloroflexota bacterium]MCI0725750.1 polysaccharide deacetylase family protein [Chloroflexota bacterium]